MTQKWPAWNYKQHKNSTSSNCWNYMLRDKTLSSKFSSSLHMCMLIGDPIDRKTDRISYIAGRENDWISETKTSSPFCILVSHHDNFIHTFISVFSSQLCIALKVERRKMWKEKREELNHLWCNTYETCWYKIKNVSIRKHCSATKNH